MHDHAEAGEPCPCGRTLPTLRRILGRTHDMLRMPSGERRFPYFGGRSLGDLLAVIQFQMAQTAPGHLEVRLVARRPLTAGEENHLRETIVGAIGYPFSIGIVYRDRIARSAGGKFEEFRCELDSSEASAPPGA